MKSQKYLPSNDNQHQALVLIARPKGVLLKAARPKGGLFR